MYSSKSGLLLFVLSTLFVASCASLPDVDPRNEYESAVRRLELNPVYPPRQSFRVGDVYAVFGGKDSIRDKALIGHLQSVEDFATRFDKGALPNHIGKQSQAAGLSDNASLMPIAFPAVTVSAASATALGLGLANTSGGLSFGRAKKITIQFKNTRGFGLPDGMAPPPEVYAPEYASLMFGVNGFCSRLSQYMNPNGLSSGQKEDFSYAIYIVTHIIVSDEIVFSFRNARAGRAGASRSTGTTSNAPVVSVDLSIDGQSQPDSIAEVMKVVAPAVDSKDQLAAGVAGASESLVTFQNNLGGYVAIAYDSFRPQGCELFQTSGD